MPPDAIFSACAGGAAMLGGRDASRRAAGRSDARDDGSRHPQRDRRSEPVKTGKVKLDVPPLVENGNTVPMTVSVAQPDGGRGSRQEHPRLQREEPAAEYRQFPSRPAQAGRAQVSTRIRLADSQKIIAIAKLSDGSFWSASVDVIVTLAACTEEPV